MVWQDFHSHSNKREVFMNNPNEFDQFCIGCLIMGGIMLIGAMVMAVSTVGGDSMVLLTWCCLIVALIRLVLYWMGFDDWR
jgi:hypothetical protein